MTNENTNPDNEKKVNFFRLMQGFNLACALQGLEGLKQLLGGYVLFGVSEKWEDLAKIPDRAVQDINDPQVQALEADIKSGQNNAEADAIAVVKDILNIGMDVSFADANTKLAVDAGASQAEEADMYDKENSFLRLVSDEDREKLEMKRLLFALCLPDQMSLRRMMPFAPAATASK